MPTSTKMIPYLNNHTPSRDTYLYIPYMGVPHPPGYEMAVQLCSQPENNQRALIEHLRAASPGRLLYEKARGYKSGFGTAAWSNLGPFPQDHLRLNLGISYGPGSFGVLRSLSDPYSKVFSLKRFTAGAFAIPLTVLRRKKNIWFYQSRCFQTLRVKGIRTKQWS